MAYWMIDDSETWITPGGDPVWCCSKCGKGRHVWGVEQRPLMTKCPDCRAVMSYRRLSNGKMYIEKEI